MVKRRLGKLQVAKIIILVLSITLGPATLFALWLKLVGDKTWWAAFDQAHEVAILVTSLVFKLLLLLFLVWFFATRSRRGATLLDLEPMRAGALFIFLAFCVGLSLMVSLVISINEFEKNPAGLPGNLLEVFTDIMLLVTLLILAFSRLQVREHGVWYYAWLIPWSTIRSYDFEQDNGLHLERVLMLRGHFPFWRRTLELSVPGRAVQSVQTYLEQHGVKPAEA